MAKTKSAGKPEAECIFVHIFLRPFSKYFTKLFLLLRLSPNMVTFIGFLVGLLAAYFFYLGDRVSLIYGAIALYASLLIGCSDGEIARLTNRLSKFGDFFDSICDMTKFYLFFFALSLGVYRTTGDVFTMIAGQFAGGAFMVGHYIRVYSYKVTVKKTYELRFTKRFAFYFTIFILLVMVVVALLNQVKPFLLAMAVIYPLTWLKKLHTVYKFTKKNKEN